MNIRAWIKKRIQELPTGEYVCQVTTLDNISAFDVLEPVVRCRDCKHFRVEPWDEVLTAQYGAPPMTCERTGDMDDVEPDGFCAWCERREKVE